MLTPTGGTAASYELDVTDQGYRFPQTWRNNIGADRKLPWGLVASGDFIYNRDVNDPVYINERNLPGAQSVMTGIDDRPRWVPTTAFPACNTTVGQAGPCVTRLNNAPGDQVTAAYVIKDSSQNYSWNVSGSVAKPMIYGFSARAAGLLRYMAWSKSLVEPSSTAGSSWGSSNPIVFDPNNPVLANLINAPGHRVFGTATYTHEHFQFGATTVSVFYDAHQNVPTGFFGANTSYVFSGDANGDTVSGNDLIYIPRDTSEMNFRPLTVSGKTYTAADQAAAFEQYIENDSYLNSHRGQYAERGGVFFPMVNRADFAIMQDIFKKTGSGKHSGQIRLDITNFGNLLNHNWGVGQRIINAQILTSPTVDAQGRLTYNLQNLNGNLLTSPLQTTAGNSDIYVMMLSFRYTFN